MVGNGAFAPRDTRKLVVTSSPQSIAVDSDAPLVRLLNIGPELVFVKVGTGDGLTVSTDTGLPVPARIPVLIEKGVGANRVAAVAFVSGKGRVSLYITAGS